MKKYFSGGAIVSNGFPFKKRKAAVRPVENGEIFDHLFIGRPANEQQKNWRKVFRKKYRAGNSCSWH